MDEQHTVESVFTTLRDGGDVPREDVSSWMSSGTKELRGLAYVCLTSVGKEEDVANVIKDSDDRQFLIEVLQEAIKDDCETETRHSRFGALLEAKRLLVSALRCEEVDLATRIRDMLYDAIVTNPSISQDVCDVVLEHVFQRQDAAKLFSNWKLDPLVSATFRNANSDAQRWNEINRQDR